MPTFEFQLPHLIINECSLMQIALRIYTPHKYYNPNTTAHIDIKCKLEWWLHIKI